MDRIRLTVDSSAPPAGEVDEMCSRVPELRRQWESELSAVSAERAAELVMPAYRLSGRPSKNFQVIGMLLTTIQAHLRENAFPQCVILTCLSEDEATMCRQVYNFYIPNTKAERMNSGLWD